MKIRLNRQSNILSTSLFLCLFLLVFSTNLSWGRNLQSANSQDKVISGSADPFDKELIEARVLKKFISLESEHEGFYRISDIEMSEIQDPQFHKPGYAVKIIYSTPTCPRNYFKGIAFSANCNSEDCPFAMIYQRCNNETFDSRI